MNIADDGNEDARIDLRKIVSIVWAKRLWVLLSVIFFTGIFAIAAFTIKPVYSASVVVIPANSGRSSASALASALGQLGGLASLAGMNIGSGDSETTETMAILGSREFIGQFINEQNLLPELFSSTWDSVNKKWKTKDSKEPSASSAYKYFTKSVLLISQDKKTSLVTIKIDWVDRVRAASWANELVSKINATMRLRAITNSEASIGYLERELKATSVVATQEAINRLIEAQVKQRMLANVAPDYAFRIVDKATAPDADEPVSPKKGILIVMGIFVGISFSVLVLLLMYWFSSTVTANGRRIGDAHA